MNDTTLTKNQKITFDQLRAAYPGTKVLPVGAAHALVKAGLIEHVPGGNHGKARAAYRAVMPATE